MLLTAALNPRPSLALRLLTWTTPSLPIGAWIAAMAGGGAALSAGATALALRGSAPELRRRVQRGVREPWDDATERSTRAWRPDDRTTARSWRDQETEEPPRSDQSGRGWVAAAAGPGREPGQPPPTVAVPYRVIRRPLDQGDGASSSGRQAASRQPEPEPVPAGADDWNDDDQESW